MAGRLPLLVSGVALAVAVVALLREPAAPGHATGLDCDAAGSRAQASSSDTEGRRRDVVLTGRAPDDSAGIEVLQQRLERLEAQATETADALGWLSRGQVQLLYPRYPHADDETEVSQSGTTAYFQRIELPERFNKVVLVERVVDGHWARVRHKHEGTTLLVYLGDRWSNEPAPRDDGRPDGVFRVTLTSTD